ncbi:PAS domain S-box protein [Acuticoccus sp. MNP-M23]|uniref:PAS domain S-box protein n=1 Tax=Acuticoccus sp. MNP-M23 TaxID=3072793 RepID=UPI002815B381|nr:PAS domain S-box protein [Acuticoccus sp. MNP-M23]WMS42021.1 PAS domain S-box protein [Acuticoccus sp. MNP-M23]
MHHDLGSRLHDFSGDGSDRGRSSSSDFLIASLDAVSDAVFLFQGSLLDDADYRIVFANRAYTALTGYSADEVLGCSHLAFQGPGTARETLRRLETNLASGKPGRYDVEFLRNTGEAWWAEFDITPVADADGSTKHFVAILRDVTDRHVRSHDEAFYRGLLDNTQEAVIVHDVDGRIVLWNRKAAERYGYSGEEAVGRPLGELNILDDSDWREAALRTCVDGRWTGRLRHTTRSGQFLSVMSTWSLLGQPEGTADLILQVSYDIAERLISDADFNRAVRLDALGKMTGGIAHDFNNILTIIIGSLDLIDRKLPDAPQLRELVHMCRASGQRGQELVSQMLTFSRRQKLRAERLELDAFLNKMLPMLRHAVAANCELQVTFGVRDATVSLDPGLLESTILNVCINASAAMPIGTGGQIDIVTTQQMIGDEPAIDPPELAPGAYVVLDITDNGKGMSESVRKRIFEPFFTTKAEGTGLGLSMVHGFIKQSGGHISVSSAPDEGTTVRLYLPRGNARTIAPALPDEVIGDGMGEVVLIVEDEPTVRENVARMLEALCYRVIRASSGEEALAIIRSDCNIDLLFTDISMPGGISGTVLARQSAKLRPAMPVLLTTGYNEGVQLPTDVAISRINILRKPYRLHELGDAIGIALRSEPWSGRL